MWDRENKVKSAIKQNKPVAGFYICTPEPALVEIMGLSGFDYVAMDMEHGRFNIESIQNMVRAAEATGIVPLARIPRDDYNIALRCLESGVQGIIMSHTKTVEDAKNLIDCVKYHPEGRRGFAVNTRSSDYGINNAGEYIKKANGNMIAGVMIEDIEGVENIEKIAELQGLDLVFVGPGDLSISMGYPCQFSHPEVIKAIDRIIDVCKSNPQISIGMFADNFDIVERWLKMGVTFISYLSEVDLFARVCRETVNRFGEIRSRLGM